MTLFKFLRDMAIAIALGCVLAKGCDYLGDPIEEAVNYYGPEDCMIYPEEEFDEKYPNLLSVICWDKEDLLNRGAIMEELNKKFGVGKGYVVVPLDWLREYEKHDPYNSSFEPHSSLEK